MLSNAYLAELGDYIADMGFRDAGPPKDQICQVWFL